MTLKLHSHPLSSYCWKVLIALHENGTPFEAPVIDLSDPQARAAFAALWPTAKIPLLEDDGRIIPETSIQIEYLDSHYPGAIALLPAQAEARLEARLWDRLFDLYVMTPMQAFVAQLLRPEAGRDPAALDKARSDLLAAYRMIEDGIGGRAWAAGADFSLADCAAAPALFYAAIIQPFPEDHPHLSAYFERLLARPSVQRAIAGARPFFRYFPLAEAMPARFR